MRLAVCRNVTESARIGSKLNSVLSTLTFVGARPSNQLTNSLGYFSAKTLQTLSKLTIYTPFHIYLQLHARSTPYLDAGAEKIDIGFDSNDLSTLGIEASIDKSGKPQHEQILLVRIIPDCG